jgi:diphthamide synthase (EF-2-diphthine--ammonia ligase)
MKGGKDSKKVLIWMKMRNHEIKELDVTIKKGDIERARMR